METAPYPRLLGKIFCVEHTAPDEYTVLLFDKSKQQFEKTTDGENPFRATRFTEFVLAERNIRLLMPDPENIFLVWPFSPGSIFVLTIPLQQAEQQILGPSAREYIEMPRMYDYSILNRDGFIVFSTGKTTHKYIDRPHMILNLNLFGPPSPPDKALAEPMRVPSIPRQGMSSMPNYLRELRRQQSSADTKIFPQMMFRDTGWRLIVTNKYPPFITFITAPSTINLVLTICIIVLLSIALMYGIHSNRKYSELTQQQRLFLNSITHELRTPIASLLGAADNLESGLVLDAPDIREYGQLISDEAKRLQTIIDSVLLFSGISSRQSAPEMMEVPVRELFSAAISKFEPVFREANFFIEAIMESETMTVYGNKALLVSMLENIIRNVQTHAFTGKFLGYGAYQTSRNGLVYTALWIRDKGNGISKNEQKRIFMPFFRGRATVDKQIQGMGIGLYIAARICQLHRGIILCESKPGLGTTFSIKIGRAHV